MVGIADRHAVLRTTYEASSSSDGADDALRSVCILCLAATMDGVVRMSLLCGTRRRLVASSAASAEGICARDASRGFALLGTDGVRRRCRTADGGCGVLRCVVVRVVAGRRVDGDESAPSRGSAHGCRRMVVICSCS